MISFFHRKKWRVFVFVMGFAVEAVAQSPTILEQPRALSVGPGDRAGFAVSVTGAAPLSYQWYRGGTLIAGATDDFLLLPSVQTKDAADYTVRISNGQGTVTSSAATLTVAAYTKEWVDPSYEGLGEPLLILPDGGTIATKVAGAPPLVRTKPDGKLDPTFVFTPPNVGPTGWVEAHAVARQDDGHLWIIFSSHVTTHAGELVAVALQRLNQDGAVDSSFTSPLDEASHYVTYPQDVAAQLARHLLLPVGEKIIVAKDGKLVRLNRDGSIDPTFVAMTPEGLPATFVVTAAALDRTGNILVGGTSGLWRLKSDGSRDVTFPLATDMGTVNEIAVSSDGGCWVGSIAPDSTWANYWNYRARRFTATGQVDRAVHDFSVGYFSTSVPALSLQADGRVVIAGDLDIRRTMGEPERVENHRGVVRLMADGSIDPSFFPTYPNRVSWPKWWMLPDGTHALSGELRMNLSTLGSIEPPRILHIEQSARSIAAGDDLTIRCIAVGPSPLTIRANGTLPNLGEDRFVLRNIQSADVVVSASGPAGEATQRVNFTLTPSAPRFTEPLAPVVARQGQWTLLNATVRGSEPITYQWFKDGIRLNGVEYRYGAGRISYSNGSAMDAYAGTYTLRASNSEGTAECSTTVTVGHTSQLSNLSVRATAGVGDNVMILGFVLQNQKKILFQAIGPELANFGVNNLLGDPTATLHGADGLDLANDNGGFLYLGQQDPIYQETGAWVLDGFTTKSSELRLESIDGVNTIVVAGKNGASGVVLAQIFDADGSTNRMNNLSARVFAGTGDATAITGFTIKGDAPRRVLIRCVGPGLSGAGVGNLLLDPQLTLVNQRTHETIVTNDNWGAGTAADVAALRSAMQKVGAFPLADGSKDAALLVTLDPGEYTALVFGANGATGIVLLEVYDVP